MHTIQPARLKPGVTAKSLPPEREAQGLEPADTAVIRGRALIFWDPMSLPGTKLARKRDAIDTALFLIRRAVFGLDATLTR